MLGLVHAFTKQLGTNGNGPLVRYFEGGSPTMSVNVRLNVPRLVNPTCIHTSVTDNSVLRSKYMARSTRRRARPLQIPMRCFPERRLEVRTKCARDAPAIPANVARSRSFSELRSIASRARNIIRFVTSTSETTPNPPTSKPQRKLPSRTLPERSSGTSTHAYGPQAQTVG